MNFRYILFKIFSDFLKMRYFLVLLFLLTLTACGGGETTDEPVLRNKVDTKVEILEGGSDLQSSIDVFSSYVS